jgi:hypothetical protein
MISNTNLKKGAAFELHCSYSAFRIELDLELSPCLGLSDWDKVPAQFESRWVKFFSFRQMEFFIPHVRLADFILIVFEFKINSVCIL